MRINKQFFYRGFEQFDNYLNKYIYTTNRYIKIINKKVDL